MLRTVIAAADKDKVAIYLHFTSPINKENLKPNVKNLDLNKLMQNVGGEQFDYGTFKAAFDTDPRIKTMVNNFDKNGLEPKTENTIDNTPQQNSTGDTVSQMAKSATDLGDNLT